MNRWSGTAHPHPSLNATLRTLFGMFHPVLTPRLPEIVLLSCFFLKLLWDNPSDTHCNHYKTRESLFSSFVTFLLITKFCSRYLFRTFSLLFYSNLFSSCNEHIFPVSLLMSSLAFTRTSCSDTFRSETFLPHPVVVLTWAEFISLSCELYYSLGIYLCTEKIWSSIYVVS